MSDEQKYTMLFKPQLFEDRRTAEEKENPELGDRRDGKVYRYKPSIILAVNVALATGRPLLVRGPSGSGKSSLAYNVARVLEREYYEFVITSRTQAQDLLWRFDAVRRLGDAQARSMMTTVGPPSGPKLVVGLPTPAGAQVESRPTTGEEPVWHNYYRYIEPGVLWWVLDPDSASSRGYEGETPLIEFASDPVVFRPSGTPTGSPVLLLDEIDKADPDFANNLLVPIGSLQFRVDEIGRTISLKRQNGDQPTTLPDRPLIIITSNEERRLPQAFLRRCVSLELEGPGADGLVEIAQKIFGDGEVDLYNQVVASMTALVREQLGSDPFAITTMSEEEKIHLNVAQFLDAVQACLKLKGVAGDDTLFKEVIRITGWKESSSI
ncbi:MAG: MoxR family ATPase [Candidatus Promineifilaceae bacterium]|nr:MoxR family ATPase [Candidatus Promineifilaceae bacterium]